MPVDSIEAQLAPNNYMYSHSMSYAYDNYTNTGINVAIQLNKNWTIQEGKQPSFERCIRWVSDTVYDAV